MNDYEKQIRVFIAISLPKNIIQWIKILQHKLKRVPADLAFPRPANLHLTLQFIGNVRPYEIPVIQGCMKDAVVDSPLPINLSVSGLGAFPHTKRARVIWGGIGGQVDRLQRLAASVSGQLKSRTEIRIEKKKFIPHLTIARIKKNIRQETVQHLIQKCHNVHSDTFEVSGIKLFKSDLRPTGAIHTELFRC